MNSVEQRPGRNALIAFRAENARSFRDPLEFSMLATGKAEPDCVREVEWREGGKPLRLLPAAAIYGANASGKTNLLRIMHDMRNLVMHSFRRCEPGGPIPRTPFLLGDKARSQPTRLEVDLILDGVRHEYGFVFDDHEVLEEWAYRYPKGRAALIFERERQEVRAGASDRRQTRSVTELLRTNALLMSTAAAANHQALLPLYRWFVRNFMLASADSLLDRQALTAGMLEESHFKDAIQALLWAADLNVVDTLLYEPESAAKARIQQVMRQGFDAGESDVGREPLHFRDLGVRLVHQGPDRTRKELDAGEESLGTQAWFGLIGPILDTLRRGTVLLADELNLSLHPALVAEIVQLFQNPKTNPHHAQLIFNTHDSTLLVDTSEDRLLGRDQIYFTDPNNDGSTRLYALLGHSPRKHEAIGKRYLQGRYGAVPIIIRPVADELALVA